MELLTERHADKIAGILTCYDRVVITGTMPQICYAAGITSWLYAHAIRIFDYPNWADQLRLKIRENAERIAKENGIEIKHLKKSSIRKEDHVQRILKSRGYEPGLVHILLFFRSEKNQRIVIPYNPQVANLYFSIFCLLHPATTTGTHSDRMRRNPFFQWFVTIFVILHTMQLECHI